MPIGGYCTFLGLFCVCIVKRIQNSDTGVGIVSFVLCKPVFFPSGLRSLPCQLLLSLCVMVVVMLPMLLRIQSLLFGGEEGRHCHRSPTSSLLWSGGSNVMVRWYATLLINSNTQTQCSENWVRGWWVQGLRSEPRRLPLRTSTIMVSGMTVALREN